MERHGLIKKEEEEKIPKDLEKNIGKYIMNKRKFSKKLLTLVGNFTEIIVTFHLKPYYKVNYFI